MKGKKFVMLAFGVSFLFLGSEVFAQAQNQQQQKQGTRAEASQFMDQTVKTPQGEELGTVDEMVIGQDGQIKFLVLRQEAGWGLTEAKKITIPFESVQVQRQQEGEIDLTADLNLDQLQLMPQDQQRQQPQQQRQGVEKLEQVLGKTVKGQQDEELGTINNIVLSPQGQASYAIISGEEDKQYPVPVNALQSGEEEDTFKLDIAKQDLQQAPSFSREIPDLSSQQWRQEVQGYYGQQQQEGAGQMMQDQRQQQTIERQRQPQQMKEDQRQDEQGWLFQDEEGEGETQQYYEDQQQQKQQKQAEEQRQETRQQK